MTRHTGLIAHIAAQLPPCCPTGTDDDPDTCTAARLYRGYLARYDRDHRLPTTGNPMTNQIVAILRQAVTTAGLDQPDIHRDIDAPGVLLVHARPTTLAQWQQWLDLLACPAGSETNRGTNTAYANGRFRGCRVHLAGHGVPELRWALRRAADPTLPEFGSPIDPS